MQNRRLWLRHGLWLRLVACAIAMTGAFSSDANAKPTEDEVDIAIKACTVMTKTDASIDGGLVILKRRILSGEGKVSYSEIPSVIGTPVTSDESKIVLFDRIQNCVIKHTYGETESYPIWRPKNYTYGQNLRIRPPTECPCISEEVVSETPLDHYLERAGRRFQCVKGSYRLTNQCAMDVGIVVDKWENTSPGGMPEKTYYEATIQLKPGATTRIELNDVCLHIDSHVFFASCPTNTNPYFQAPVPSGTSRACFVSKRVFESRGKPWGRLVCDPLKQRPPTGNPGDACACSLENADYPGVFLGSTELSDLPP